MVQRIADSYMSRVLVGTLQRNLGDLLRLQQVNSTMRRINSYADDPRAVGAVQRYNTLLTVNEQYVKNLDRSRIFVDATDAALQDVVDIIRELREITLRESSASGTPTSNEHSADEVDNLIGRLMGALNANVEGNFLFGGFRTDLTPFVKVGDIVQYQGDGGEITARIGPHTQAVVNIPGSAVLGAATAIRVGNVSVAPDLSPSTSLGSLNLGQGWQPGAISLTDGSGQVFVVNLAGATDIAGVLARIQTATGGAVTATVAPGGQGLQLVGSGPLSVAEVDGGATARSLGLLGTAADGNFFGTDIRALPTATTLLTEISALAGSLPLGSLNISQGSTSVAVDFSGATTLGDLQAAVSAALPGMQLRLDGGVLSLVSDSTVSFEVTNVVGSTTATDLGLVGTGTPARLFGVFEAVQTALRAHDRDALRGLFSEMGAVEDGVLGLLVKTGGREVMLDWMQTILQQRDEQLQANRSRQRDADLIETASELSLAEAAYQASLLSASRLFEVNLMSYLR